LLEDDAMPVTSRFSALFALVAPVLFGLGCAAETDADPEASAEDDLTAGRYKNPLLSEAYCGAPNVRKVGSKYVLICASAGIGTASDAYHIRTSADLVHWSAPKTVFTPGSHPAWAKAPGQGSYWCPEIYRVDNKWVILFAATKPGASNSMAIGQAWADSLDGPWHPSAQPLVAQGDGSIAGPKDDYSGRIDPTLLFDEATDQVYRDAAGDMYMYYVYQPRGVRLVKVHSDGHGHLSIVPKTDHDLMLASGQRFTTTLPWELNVIEGVEAQRRSDGTIYLFYSGASAWDPTYATGVARSATPDGPFHKRPQPILSTEGGGELVGPGHGSQWVLAPNGKPYLPYRVQRREHTGRGGAQLLAIEPIYFDAEGWPRVIGGDHPHTSGLPTP
jgi:beta-xylosidase